MNRHRSHLAWELVLRGMMLEELCSTIEHNWSIKAGMTHELCMGSPTKVA